MDFPQIFQSFVIAVLGATFVKLLDLTVNRFQQRYQRKEKTIESIMELLDDYADLASLYYRLARKEEAIARDEDGSLLKNRAGEYIVNKSSFEVESNVEDSFLALFEVSIREAIQQKQIQILLKTNRKLDLVNEVDPTGKLRKKFTDLYWYTIHLPQSRLEDNDFDNFVEALRSAGETRKEVRSILEKYLKR